MVMTVEDCDLFEELMARSALRDLSVRKVRWDQQVQPERLELMARSVRKVRQVPQVLLAPPVQLARMELTAQPVPLVQPDRTT